MQLAHLRRLHRHFIDRRKLRHCAKLSSVGQVDAADGLPKTLSVLVTDACSQPIRFGVFADARWSDSFATANDATAVKKRFGFAHSV